MGVGHRHVEGRGGRRRHVNVHGRDRGGLVARLVHAARRPVDGVRLGGVVDEERHGLLRRIVVDLHVLRAVHRVDPLTHRIPRVSNAQRQAHPVRRSISRVS